MFVKPPGWFPEQLGGFQSAPEIDVANYRKYHTITTHRVMVYAVLLFLVALALGSYQLFYFNKLSLLTNVLIAIFTILSMLTCGALLEKKRWFVAIEWIRYLLGLFALYFLYSIGFQLKWLLVILALHSLMAVYFFFIKSSYRNA